jgi:putative protease
MTNLNNRHSSTIPLELLAPARNLEIGRLAVLAGADAVYIGAPQFGARQAASNSWDDIAELIEFAHQYYVKVYIALNTIFFDNEIKAVQEAINKAYTLGADALIIQDMAILEMDLPPIPLFASTQTDNRNSEQIKFLEAAGLSRVILARELSLEQIADIRAQTKIELESFVHGALCVSLSGRCYFSCALSGVSRSANRGACQQVCRTVFSLVDANGQELIKDKYLLSLKDLNLSAVLPELIAAGVTSFKIEGRLKDATYVANVTAKYRQELDKIIEQSQGRYRRASSGRAQLDFKPDLAKTFNRGYTDYFINGRHNHISSPDFQKSLGKLVGQVKRVDHRYFTLDRAADLHNTDGLCWLNSRDQLVGTNINLVKDGKIYPNKWLPLKPGTFVYRNQDLSFEKAAVNGVSRFIKIAFKIKETVAGVAIEISDEDDNRATLDFTGYQERAEKPEQAEETWRQQLTKLGGTIFESNQVSYEWTAPLFVPVGILNEWRRQLLAALMVERIKNYPQLTVKHQSTSQPFPLKKLDYSFNVANQLADKFYQRHGAVEIEAAFEKQTAIKGKKIMTTKHCLRYELGACPKYKTKAALKKLAEPLYLVQGSKKYRLGFNCAECLMEIYD